MRTVEVVALSGVPEVEPGTDLVALVVDACAATGVALASGDVVCVAQKVVSKAEGALVRLAPGDPSAARRTLAREHAVRVVAEAPQVLVVETRHGFVCANAGIDASNVADGYATLLPDDPDASAARLAAGLTEATGARVGVVISDTFGRPWRTGQTDVAIGVAGIAPLRDERGTPDRNGRRLDATVVAVADELAAAADLARGKADGVPIVVVRGAPVAPDPDATARALVRPPDEDLFRWGGPQAVVQGLLAVGDTAGQRPVDPGVLDVARAVAVPDPARSEGLDLIVASDELRLRLLGVTPDEERAPLAAAPTLIVPVVTRDADVRVALLAAGEAVGRLRAVLAAHGVGSGWVVRPGDLRRGVAVALRLPPGAMAVGILAAGAGRLR